MSPGTGPTCHPDQPDGLPGLITLQNIRDEHYSRNPRIMGVLTYLRVVEEYGPIRAAPPVGP